LSESWDEQHDSKKKSTVFPGDSTLSEKC